MTEQEKSDMFLRNEKFIYWYLKKKGLMYMVDDLYEVAVIGLVHGINKYDETKNVKESTFLISCIINSINNYFYLQNMPKRRCEQKAFSLEGIIPGTDNLTLKDVIEDPTENIERKIELLELENIINNCLNKLSDTDRKIIVNYFGIQCQPKTVIEISKELKVSRQSIYSRINKIKMELKRELIKIDYCL